MMNDQQVFLKSLLKQEFYEKTKHKISVDLFPDRNFKKLFRLISETHEKYEKDISLQEVESLLFSNNPTITEAEKYNYKEVFKELKNIKDFQPEYAYELLNNIWREYYGVQIADLGYKIAENQEYDLDKLQKYLDTIRDGVAENESLEVTTDDLESLLDNANVKGRWTFNLPGLQKTVQSLPDGSFTIITARPDAGKTACYISLAFGPDGWVWQGANVAIFANEEPTERLMLRCYSSFTGMTTDNILEDKDRARDIWNTLKSNGGNYNLVHTGKQDTIFTMEDLDHYCAKNSPDIVVIDQLDKMTFRKKDSNQSEHHRLGQLYIEGRSLAIRRNCAVIAISQASAEADNKLFVSYNALKDSKTDKAAEGDLIIGIGKRTSDDGVDDGLRCLSFSKNKITGITTPVTFKLDKQLSRMLP